MQAISNVKKVSDVLNLLNFLYEWNDKYPERLSATFQILEAILTRPSDQLRWSIQDKKIRPLLARGFKSADDTIQIQAEKCRDLLLKLCFFDFLDLTVDTN